MRKIFASLVVIGLLITIIPMFVPSAAAADGWTLVSDARGMKAYPELRGYIWQKNANMAPNGPYDKIGLHRLVKQGITPKAVIFLCPGTYGNAEQFISNPPADNWTKYENYSQPIYWANRGFDVYGIDYRTHFVPSTLNSTQLSFMANWGFDQWISDIKEAVDKAKEVSGAKKVFMAGMSFGGQATTYYASKYWKQDLRGIILLDGGNGTTNASPTNTYNLTAALGEMNTTGTWSTEFGAPPSGTQHVFKYAFENPNGPAVVPFPGGINYTLQPPLNPATNKTWANVTEWGKWRLRTSKTNANLIDGYGDYFVTIQNYATSDRYWPRRLGLEFRACGDWTECPYVTYDFDDFFDEIDVPLLGFVSEHYGVGAFGNITHGIVSLDVTGVYLPKYGHIDVFVGVYSARDVSEPIYQWMLNHMSGAEKGDLQGVYRDWKVLLWDGKIYIAPPQTLTNVSPSICIGTWDAEYYGKLGKTIVDAAKPAIDECISGCR